jgi:hypothetical protein
MSGNMFRRSVEGVILGLWCDWCGQASQELRGPDGQSWAQGYRDTAHRECSALTEEGEPAGIWRLVVACVPERTARSEAEGGERGLVPEQCAQQADPVVNVEELQNLVLRSDASPGQRGLIIDGIVSLQREKEEALRECGRLREVARTAEEARVNAEVRAGEAACRAHAEAQRVNELQRQLQSVRLEDAEKVKARIRVLRMERSEWQSRLMAARALAWRLLRAKGGVA